ncbi:MAG TPA: hypothetical protein VN605_07030 [Thermoanaerobaculia bacterium]|nr:hypothetical protein [Thermoanaerobaculia bacterium]
MSIDQKPLYRRVQRALLTIKQSLAAAGFSTTEMSEILANRGGDLDFGFATPQPSGDGTSDGRETT